MREIKKRVRRVTLPDSVVLDGVTLPVDQDICSPAIRRQIYDEAYEADERRLIPGIVSFEDRVLELGAGIGLVSAIIRRCKPSASLHVEANATVIPAIRATLAANDLDAEILHGAVVADGDLSSHVTLRTGSDFWSASLYDREGLDQTLETPAITLDSLLSSFQPTVLVIDVEGAECDLLSQSNLPGVRAIAVELHARITGRARQSKMIAHLLSEGFDIDFASSKNETALLLREPD